MLEQHGRSGSEGRCEIHRHNGFWCTLTHGTQHMHIHTHNGCTLTHRTQHIYTCRYTHKTGVHSSTVRHTCKSCRWSTYTNYTHAHTLDTLKGRYLGPTAASFHSSLSKSLSMLKVCSSGNWRSGIGRTAAGVSSKSVQQCTLTANWDHGLEVGVGVALPQSNDRVVHIAE